MTLEVVYSSHAGERMVLRGISRREAETAIRLGTKSRQGDRILATFSYFEVGRKVIHNRAFVITVKPNW